MNTNILLPLPLLIDKIKMDKIWARLSMDQPVQTQRVMHITWKIMVENQYISKKNPTIQV